MTVFLMKCIWTAKLIKTASQPRMIMSQCFSHLMGHLASWKRQRVVYYHRTRTALLLVRREIEEGMVVRPGGPRAE